MLNSDNNKMRVYCGFSKESYMVVFQNVVIHFRVPALLLGNANGNPLLRYCALFSGTDNTELGMINDGSITIKDNGNGTADISISSVAVWGIYYLIVFY